MTRRQPIIMDKPDIEKNSFRDPQAFGLGEKAGVGYRLHKPGDARENLDEQTLDAMNRQRDKR